jgi:DeoR family fructose operon transcriptional repressor
MKGTLHSEERRAAMRRTLQAERRLDLAEQARQWAVHPMTIRRDFAALEAEGTARRVRGGLVPCETADFHQRQSRQLAAKRKIAAKLVPLIQPDSVIGMDSSTTVHQLALRLPAMEGLTVVANGVSSIDVLRRQDGVQTFLTGGLLESHHLSMVGPMAAAAIGSFHLNQAFMSTTCLDPDFGSSEETMEEAGVKVSLADAADEVVLAVDSTKLNRRSHIRSLDWDAIDVLVTELAPDDPRLAPFRDRVRVI